MSQVHLPRSFSEWRHCIEKLCQTPLTEDFVERRIAELGSLSTKLDQRFVELYGVEHKDQVLQWYLKVREEALYAP